MQKLPLTDARAVLGDLCTKVAFEKKPVVLTKNGKDLVAVVSMEDFARLGLAKPDAPRKRR